MALDTDTLVQCLSQARSDLESLLAVRAKVVTAVDTKLAKGHSRLRSALCGVIGELLPAFRIHADNMACLVVDLNGPVLAKFKPATESAVDMFFGPTLFDGKTATPLRSVRPRQRANTRRNVDAPTRAVINKLEKNARAFTKSVRALPHESAKRRLDACEARFEKSWKRVHRALRETS